MSNKKHDKLIKTIKLLKSKSKKKKDMGKIDLARRKLDDTLSLENSFNRSLLKAKDMSKEIHNFEDIKYPEMNFDDTTSVDTLKDDDDYDINETGTYSSNYDYYNKRYKMLNLPTKLENGEVIKFDIFPEYKKVQHTLNKVLFYTLITILVLGLLFLASKLIRYIRKSKLNIKK